MNKHFDFSKLSEVPGELSWLNQSSLKSFQLHSAGLAVHPHGKTDFWRKTYYDPVILKSDGPALLYRIPAACAQWSAETEFSLSPLNQFDQAGIMVFIDNSHWLKTGIEFVDGSPKMSCVVTNGNTSDWSTQPWDGESLDRIGIRVSYIRESYVVERKVGSKWEFIRITSLAHAPQSSPVSAGLYCCSPTAEGGSATFPFLAFRDSVEVGHHA